MNKNVGNKQPMRNRRVRKSFCLSKDSEFAEILKHLLSDITPSHAPSGHLLGYDKV